MLKKQKLINVLLIYVERNTKCKQVSHASCSFKKGLACRSVYSCLASKYSFEYFP